MKNLSIFPSIFKVRKGALRLFVCLFALALTSTPVISFEVYGPDEAGSKAGLTDAAALKSVSDGLSAGFKTVGGPWNYSRIAFVDQSDFYEDSAFMLGLNKESSIQYVDPARPAHIVAPGAANKSCDVGIDGLQAIVSDSGDISISTTSNTTNRAWASVGVRASAVTVGNAANIWCVSTDPGAGNGRVWKYSGTPQIWNSVWGAFDGTDKNIFVDNQVTTVNGPQAFQGIAAGMDGTLWFVERGTGQLKKRMPDGTVKSVNVPSGVVGNIACLSAKGTADKNFVVLATKAGKAYSSKDNGPFKDLALSSVSQICVGIKGTVAFLGKEDDSHAPDVQLGPRVMVAPGAGDGSLSAPAPTPTGGALKYGSAFNLLHVQSGKYVSYLDMHYFAIPGDPNNRTHTVIPGPKDYRSRWVASDSSPSPGEEGAVYGREIADGADFHLKNMDTDFGLIKDGSHAFRGVHSWGLGPMHVKIFRKISDGVFAMTDGADNIVGFNGQGFGYVANSAAAQNPQNFPEFHFQAVDAELDYGQSTISNLTEVTETLPEKGFRYASGPMPSEILDGRIKPYHPHELRRVSVTLDENGTPQVFGIRASDSRVVKMNPTQDGWTAVENFTPHIVAPRDTRVRFPTYADSISSSTDGRLMAADRRNLNADPSGWSHELLELPWKNIGNANVNWKSSNIRATEVSTAGNHTLVISETLGMKMLLKSVDDSGAGEFEAIETDFPVLDAAVGNDGTVWCLNTGGFLHRIDAGTYSYADSAPETRNVLGRNPNKVPGTPNPWDVADELRWPGNVKVRAAGSANENIVAVLNSKGEVFISQSGGQFTSLGVKGIVDLDVAEDGTMVLLSPVGPQNFSGIPWIGNYFDSADGEEAKKIADAKAAASRVGPYTGFLDAPVLISQGGKYFTMTDDYTLEAKSSEPDSRLGFRFSPRGTNAYAITYDEQTLAVSKTEAGGYELILTDFLGADDSDLFYVYGDKETDQVRVRHKDVYLSAGADGTVTLSGTESMLKFEDANAVQIAAGNQALNDLETLQVQLEQESQNAVDQVTREIAELQKQLIAEKIEGQRAELQAKIDDLLARQETLNAQKAAAAQLKADMQAKLDAIEAERQEQERMLEEKLSSLEAELAAETDPVRQQEIQKQIDALKGSKESLADVLMQNAEVLGQQAKQEATLLKQKAALEREIAEIAKNAESKAAMAKQAFSGDIANMVSTIIQGTRAKLASALKISEAELASTFPEDAEFGYPDMVALASVLNTTQQELSASIKSVYIKTGDEAFNAVKNDFGRLSALQDVSADEIVAAFKQDLGRFGQSLGMDFNAITEALSYGFKGLKNKEKITQLEALLAEQESDEDRNEVLTELFNLDKNREGTPPAMSWDGEGIGSEQGSEVVPAVRERIAEIHKSVDDDFDAKIKAAFTATPAILGSAWDLSRDMVARVVNYDVLEEKYREELAALNAQRDELKSKLSAAIDENEALRAKLRTFMDERAGQQEEIDAKITELRRNMVAATTAADMETFVAQVKALKSSNDEIMEQLRANDIKIYENEKVIMKQETKAKVLEQTVEEVKLAQEVFMQEAAKEKRAIEQEINTLLEKYTKDDDAYQAEVERINSMVTGTAEGITKQQRLMSELQTGYFAKKKEILNQLQDVNTRFIASIEKIKSALTEQVAELEGKKRMITQVYNETLANLSLDNANVDPNILAAEKASYDEKIQPVDDKIDELSRLIDSKETDIRAVQRENMDRLKALNDQVREASAAQIEQMRYQMLAQGDEERQAAQEKIKRIEADNAKMLKDVNAIYEATKAKLQANAEKVKAANEERTAQLASSLESHKARYADHQNQLNDMIAEMIAQGEIAEQQQELFENWKVKVKSAVDARSNAINLVSANFRETVNDQPQSFDKNIDGALTHDMKESLPGIPKLLDIIGLKTELSVREELIRETAITDFEQIFDGQALGSGTVSVIGFTQGGADQTYGYLQKDATEIIIRDTISILNNIKLKIVKRPGGSVSIELPDGSMRMTLADDGSISLTPAANSEADGGTVTADPSQVFGVEHQDNGEFVLTHSDQYLTIFGEISSASTAESARLTLGGKGSAAKFITFKMPSAEFDEEFNILKSELPAKFKAFKASLAPDEFKAKIAEFKDALALGFASIESVKDNFLAQVQTILGQDELTAISDLETAKKAEIDASVVEELKDPETEASLQELLDANTDLDDKTKSSVQELVNEGERQLDLVGRIAKEQNYRVVELRKTYLETTMEKNQQIGFLEADSRWQKFQWARDIYLLIQLQLDASERDKIEFEKELQAASDKFDSKRDELVAERDKTVENLKDTLQKKIEASQRASQELKKLGEEKETIFQDHLAQMQKDWESLSAEERAVRDKRMNMMTEEHAALTKDINDKYAHKLKMITLDQERVEALGAMKVSILERKILNAQQYLISFKIDSGTEVVLSHFSDVTGQTRYVRQSKFDDLQVSQGIRFDQSARLKMVTQADATYSLETVDGARRLTLVGDSQIDLLDAIDIPSTVKGEEGMMVADPSQTFFAEGSQADGVVFRDKNKTGYITIEEVLSEPDNPQSKKINVLAFTTSDAALDKTVEGEGAGGETLFNIIKFSQGAGTIEELLSRYYSDQDSSKSDEAIAAAEEFFNNNRIYNYPHRMDNFIQAVSEFGQGRVSTGLMTESALEATNELLYQINESFNFSISEEGTIVSSGSQIRLLDQDYVEPVNMKEGQIVVISYGGKHLSHNEVVDENGKTKIQFVDGNLFDQALNLKVIGNSKKNTVSLTDLEGKKRLNLSGSTIRWVDASEAAGDNDFFIFSGTRHSASIMAGGLGVTIYQKPLMDENGQMVIGEDGKPKGSGEITLKTTDSMDEAVTFKLNVFQPGSFEAMLVGQGVEKYGNNAESKQSIEAITTQLIDMIEGSDFDDDDKNSFLNSFANYLEAYVNPESMAMWANSVKRVGFVAKQSMAKVDPAIMGKLSSTVKEFQVESGTYLVLKNIQEEKYLAVDENRRAVGRQSKQATSEMLFKVVRQGDKYALVARNGSGGYLTVSDAGIIESTTQALSSDGNVSSQPEANQLFWLIGHGNQLSLKMGETTIQEPEGYLAVHPNLQLTSWDFDNPEDKPKYKSNSARTKFEVQILDEYSLLRGIINDGAASVTGNFLEGLMATREDPSLSDEQKSLSAQQKLKDFEEFVLQKEVLPAEQEGGDPIIIYTLKPEFEELRQVQTDEAAGTYSLKDTLEYIEDYVFYDPVAKAGIKLGKVGDTIFRAMKEAFSQFRLLEKRLDSAAIDALVNPGSLEIQLDEKGNPLEDYIGKHLDGLLGDEVDPIVTAPAVYAYILNLARTLYSPEYKDNSIRFTINENGQLVDNNGMLYTFDQSGQFLSSSGQPFSELAEPITDPDGKLLAEAEEFIPGIILTVSSNQTTVTMDIPSKGSAEDAESLKAEIKASEQLSQAKKQGLLAMLASLSAGPDGNFDFGPVRRTVEATKQTVHLSFSQENRGAKLTVDSQLSTNYKTKISRALSRFIDGNSFALTRIENGKEFLSKMQGSTLLPPFSEMKDRLIREFKFASNFREEDLTSMIRQISARSEHETNEWRREMIVELLEFVGTKAWYEKTEDGSFELKQEEGKTAAIYNKQDILDLIDRIKRQLLEVVLGEGQISISQKYDFILNQAMELYFAGSYTNSVKQLKQFEDDNAPKDWTADEAPREWFDGVRPMPGDGSQKAKEKNQYDRSKAWNDNRPVYSIRLLTSEQQTMRMNLLEYAKKSMAKAARRAAKSRTRRR